MPMFSQKYSVVQVAEALTKAGGIVDDAARLIGCNRRTIQTFIAGSDRCRKARDEARETTIDLAESKLMEKIREGNVPSIIFYLKTQGKSRGYIEGAGASKSDDENPNLPRGKITVVIPDNGRAPLKIVAGDKPK